MRSYWNTYTEWTVYHLDRHTTSLQTLWKKTDVHLEKDCKHHRNLKYIHCKKRNSVDKTNVFKTECSASTCMATPTTDASGLMQVESNLQSMSTRATRSTKRCTATFVSSEIFCDLCLEKPHNQIQSPFMSNHLRQRYAAESNNNLSSFPLRQQERVNSNGQAHWIEDRNKCSQKKQLCSAASRCLRFGRTNSRESRMGGLADSEV